MVQGLVLNSPSLGANVLAPGKLHAQLPPSLLSLHVAVGPLDGQCRVQQNEVLPPLFKAADPALEESGRRPLVKDLESFEGIVGHVSHEYLVQTQLHVGFGKGEGKGLGLHATNLFRAGNA